MSPDVNRLALTQLAAARSGDRTSSRFYSLHLPLMYCVFGSLSTHAYLVINIFLVPLRLLLVLASMTPPTHGHGQLFHLCPSLCYIALSYFDILTSSRTARSTGALQASPPLIL